MRTTQLREALTCLVSFMTTMQQKFLRELKDLFDKYKVILDSESQYKGSEEIYCGEIYTLTNENRDIDIEINDLQLYLSLLGKKTPSKL